MSAYHDVCCASFGAAVSLVLPGRGNTPLLVSALRRPPLGRPRARRAIGLAQVQDRPLAVRPGRIMAHFIAPSNLIPPLDHSPESHASPWAVSAWDGRRPPSGNTELGPPALPCAPVSST